MVYWTVQWLGRLKVVFSQHTLGLINSCLHVRFLADEMAVERFSVWPLWCSRADRHSAIAPYSHITLLFAWPGSTLSLSLSISFELHQLRTRINLRPWILRIFTSSPVHTQDSRTHIDIDIYPCCSHYRSVWSADVLPHFRLGVGF